MHELQLSLVTSGGILLASKPEEIDDTKQVLASGLISAIITFAKEVHQTDLQSLSYYDRNVSFVSVHEFVVIVESRMDEETFSERQLKQLLEQIRLSASPLLVDRVPETVSFGEAGLILEHCLHDINHLQLFFTKNPLINAEPSKITLKHLDDKWEIIEKVGDGTHFNYIAEMVHNNLDIFLKQYSLKGIIILLPEQKFTVYAVVITDGIISDVGMLKFPIELDFTLFRLFPYLQETIKIYSPRVRTDVLDILDTLQKSEDPGIRFFRIEIEDLSLAFLFNIIEKNISHAIYSVITGKPVYVIGNRLSVRLVIDTLSVFSQHLSVESHDWVTILDVEAGRKCDLSTKICGMASNVYQELLSSGQIEKDATLIDLDNATVEGHFESFYFMKILEENRLRNIEAASVLIFHELRKLVSMSYIITSFALDNKELAQQKLKDLTLQSPFPGSFTMKAIELASKCNFLIEYLS
ncbi:MAG: hypothetical protein ACXABK_06255 [Candidatus Heimdallarchaeaceae archaeon]|jgi:hypothetical protein